MLTLWCVFRTKFNARYAFGRLPRLPDYKVDIYGFNNIVGIKFFFRHPFYFQLAAPWPVTHYVNLVVVFTDKLNMRVSWEVGEEDGDNKKKGVNVLTVNFIV